MALVKFAKDTMVYGAADFAGKLLAFFTFPIVARVLEPEDFGALELSMTLVSLLGLCVGCGINNAVQRFYWDNKAREISPAVILSSGLFIQFVIGACLVLLLALSLILFSHFSEREIPVLSVYAVIALIVMIPTAQWYQYFQDVTRLLFMPWRFFSLSIITKFLTAAVTLYVVVYLGAGVDGYIFAQAGAALVAVILGWVLVKKHFALQVEKEISLDLFKFGYPFVFTMLAYWLLGAIDRWMLVSLFSLEEAGIYSISFRFSSLAVFISGAFSLAWSPFIMKIYAEFNHLYSEVAGIVLVFLTYVMLFFAGGLALFSGEIIGVFMTEPYFNAAAPLVILCFSVLFQSSTQISGIGISMAKKTKVFAYLVWAAVSLNVGCNWFLIPEYGALGASVSTLISYLFLFVSYLIFTQLFSPIKVLTVRLFFLYFLGALVLCVSFLYLSLELKATLIGAKLFFAFILIFVGYMFLPLKEAKKVLGEVDF